MKTSTLVLGLVSATMFCTTPVSAYAAEGPGSATGKAGHTGKSWAVKMRGLQSTLQELLIDLNSDDRFNSSSNFKRIEKNVEKFSKLAHELKLRDGASPDADPTIQIIAGQFSEEADRAYQTLKSGNRAYARDMLRSMTGYCMACHTRSDKGSSFQGIASSPEALKLSSLERADLLTSTRQFDQALEEYEKIVSEPASAEHRPFDWERAIRSGLAVAVRVKKDPDRALSLVNRVLATPKSPYFLKVQASQWKQSLEEWKAEGVAKPLTEQGYYAQAVKLVAEAKALQKYPLDRSADILYLRASSAVHDQLSFAPKGERVADALYLAGLSYEVLHDLNLWDQHEFYYLACIMKSPQTETARQCFKHYEQSVYLGYTGSAGTDLPSEVIERLRKLDKLSTPPGTKPLN